MIIIKYIAANSAFMWEGYLTFKNTNTIQPHTPRIYLNPKNNNINRTELIGYDLITKIVKEKDMKDVILNLRHENSDIRILCEEIISNGYESIKVL